MGRRLCESPAQRHRTTRGDVHRYGVFLSFKVATRVRIPLGMLCSRRSAPSVWKVRGGAPILALRPTVSTQSARRDAPRGRQVSP